MSNQAVFGIVRSEQEAEGVIADLSSAGIPPSSISVLLPNKGATRDFAHAQGTKAPEGAVAGGSAGGVLGGALGLLAGIGAVTIPGFGLLLAAGPILAALSGAAVGAAVGSVAGGLIGLGIPEIQAKLYEGKIRDGNVLMSVHTTDGKQIDAARKILAAHNASDISVANEASVSRAQQPAPTASAAPSSMR